METKRSLIAETSDPVPGRRPPREPGKMATEAVGFAGAVAEVQGVYGPFTFPEKLLQKLWLRRDFDVTAARTLDGRRLEVRHPGRWNGLGGPDFLGARLRLDGRDVEGDVEVHLRAEDWDAHGHARDPAYARVVLHVVLFTPRGVTTEGGAGRPIPIVVLLPLLHHDLEAYAADEAVAVLANRPGGRILEELGGRAPAEVERLWRHHARNRWHQKVRFARRRLTKLGWVEACHQAALEVLGYRFNRAPMLRLATAEPWAAWVAGGVDLEAWLRDETVGWSHQGVRPANHPRTRLRQYAAWVAAAPDWPTRLEALGRELVARPEPDVAADPVVARRASRARAERDRWAERLTGRTVGGPRLDTLIGDAWLPLLAAGEPANEAAAFAWWSVGWPGDLPDYLRRGMTDLHLSAARGPAQGLLGWLLDRDGAA